MKEKSKSSLLSFLEGEYLKVVKSKYDGKFLEALQDFDIVAENELRKLLNSFYTESKSRDQAWKGVKGNLYEFAVFHAIKQVIENEKKLSSELDIIMGGNLNQKYLSQIVIKNWCDILPDADIVVVNKKTNTVKAIISCKTSLRERLTETAFWKRELERTSQTKNIKILFITTDKDEELKLETNRYILLHVIDCTFVTDLKKYQKLISFYEKKYGKRKDFELLKLKVRPITEIKEFLLNLL
jgi:type II restriction enzyme